MIYLDDQLEQLDVAAALAMVSEQRREQVLRYRNEQLQRQSLAAYLLLCRGLREQFGVTDAPVFGHSLNGKPFLWGHPDIHFNMSHCRHAVAVAIDSHPVGIDVESIGRHNDALIRYAMSDEECRQISHSARPDIEFTRLWTMKESLLKLTGQGIRDDLHHILDSQDDYLFTTQVHDRYVCTLCQYRFSEQTHL